MDNPVDNPVDNSFCGFFCMFVCDQQIICSFYILMFSIRACGKPIKLDKMQLSTGCPLGCPLVVHWLSTGLSTGDAAWPHRSISRNMTTVVVVDALGPWPDTAQHFSNNTLPQVGDCDSMNKHRIRKRLASLSFLGDAALAGDPQVGLCDSVIT